MKLKPSGYSTASESREPGYLRRKLRQYAKDEAERKAKAEAVRIEAAAKVRKIGKAP